MPQQNLFKFGSIRISSQFDTGNLSDVSQLSARNFLMELSSDGEPYIENLPYHTWFHFRITGFEAGK